MKKLIYLTIGFILTATFMLKGQTFSGFRSGNYRGVTGVFFNPANIADSRYRWDVNLFSVNTVVGNDKADFRISDLTGNFNEDEFRDKLLGGEGTNNAQMQFDFLGPSFMFNTGKKNSFALSTRARAWVNVIDLDGRLAESVTDGSEISYPFTMNSKSNNLVLATGWSEFGVTWARVLMNEGKNFLKGGLTAKYIAPALNGSLRLDQFNATINEDAQERTYLTNTSGLVQLNFGGFNFDNLDPIDLLNFSSGSFGADLGFVYEYRPGNQTDLAKNKYKWRISAAVQDIGKLRFTKDTARSGAYQANISESQRFYLDNLDDVPLEEFKQVLNDFPQYFTNKSNSIPDEYSVSLPTTLQFDVDYLIGRGFYVNLGAQLPLSSNAGYNRMRQYSQFTLTPRYEGRGFGFYLPVQSSSLTGFTTGFALRAGPLFLGSGSVITALTRGSKQADFFMGLRFGGLFNKNANPKKDINPEVKK
jgi:hypothetical protein